MSVEENKALARRFVDEVANKANMAAVDELVSTGFIDHTPFPGQKPGPDGVKQVMTIIHSAFPDVEHLIEDVIAEGDKVVVRAMWRGTHQGMFMGIPASGLPVKVTAIHIMRFADGRMVEAWAN